MISFNHEHEPSANPLYRQLLNATELLQAAANEIKRLECDVAFHRRDKGNKWEETWAGLARDRGLRVEPPTNRQHDWIVNGMKVECKHKEGAALSLLTTPVKGRDYRGYNRDDWDVLVILNSGVMRIIPAGLLLHDDGYLIRNTFTPSAWTEWVDRWDVFGGTAAAPVIRQTLLFGGEE